MKQFIKWFGASFDTNSVGSSARKLTAFIVNVTYVISCFVYIRWAFIHGSWDHFDNMLWSLVGYGSLCLGLTTYSAMKGRPKEESTVTKTDTSTTETKVG